MPQRHCPWPYCFLRAHRDQTERMVRQMHRDIQSDDKPGYRTKIGDRQHAFRSTRQLQKQSQSYDIDGAAPTGANRERHEYPSQNSISNVRLFSSYPRAWIADETSEAAASFISLMVVSTCAKTSITSIERFSC